MKKWVVLDQKSDIKDQKTTGEIVEVILRNRGIITTSQREKFLHPTLDDVSIQLVGIDKKECKKALKRIKVAIQKKESIVVYTDYDVDGVTSGALMWETLYGFGAKVMPYVPHREKEGYGLSKIGIDQVKKELEAKLIITVDHGITAAEKIEYAKSLGIDVIILDHHVIPAKLPDCEAIVHTTKLAAAGIAWLFCDYLISNLTNWTNLSYLKMQNLELAVLGTIADLIPLVGPNRVIAKFGLEQLRETKRIGLKTLFKESSIKQEEIDTYTVSHMIAPRINAVGRITHAIDALRLLCTKDRARAAALAQTLGSTNRQRQSLTQDSLSHALDLVKNETKTKKKLQKILIVSHESYQQGIIGLIAGKLTEIFTRPSIAISVGEVYSKASARSVPGFNIVETFRKVSDLLVDVGGHPMAAGFTIETKKIEILKARLLELADKELDEKLLHKTVAIDMPLDFGEITPSLLKAITQLAPFGVGNPQPVFASLGIKVKGARKIGRDLSHLKLRVSSGALQFDAVGFGMGDLLDRLTLNEPIDIAYTIDENVWNGTTTLQLKLKDVRIAGKS